MPTLRLERFQVDVRRVSPEKQHPELRCYFFVHTYRRDCRLCQNYNPGLPIGGAKSTGNNCILLSGLLAVQRRPRSCDVSHGGVPPPLNADTFLWQLSNTISHVQYTHFWHGEPSGDTDLLTFLCVHTEDVSLPFVCCGQYFGYSSAMTTDVQTFPFCASRVELKC